MDNEKCETCRFRESRLQLDPDGKWRPNFYPKGLTEAEYEARGEVAAGECHRMPPSIRDDEYREFVVVRLDDWCGEWQAKRATLPVAPPEGNP